MAPSLQLSWLCRVKQMPGIPTLRLFPQHSTIWPPTVYRAPCCKFSKSSGPVRYIPKGSRSHGRGEQSHAQSQTKKPADVSAGNEVEGMDRFGSCRQSKKIARSLKIAGDVDDEFCRSAKLSEKCGDLATNEEECFEYNRSPGAQQINGKRGLSMQTDSPVFPLRQSKLTALATLENFISKARKAASIKATSEELGPVRDKGNSSDARAAGYAPETRPENEANVLMDDNSPTLDDPKLLDEDFLGDTAKHSFVVQLTDTESTRVTEAEAASRAAQEDAKRQAIRYLAMRQYTEFDLRKKLRSRNISPELVDYALRFVKDCGMQSDLTYAETYAHSRWNVGSWGPRRIMQALKQRGVSDNTVKLVIDRVFNENKNDLDHWETNSTGMSKSAIDQLLMQASKQWNRGKNVSDDTKVRRMISWLQYRGFNYKVIQIVLKSLRKRSLYTEI